MKRLSIIKWASSLIGKAPDLHSGDCGFKSRLCPLRGYSLVVKCLSDMQMSEVQFFLSPLSKKMNKRNPKSKWRAYINTPNSGRRGVESHLLNNGNYTSKLSALAALNYSEVKGIKCLARYYYPDKLGYERVRVYKLAENGRLIEQVDMYRHDQVTTEMWVVLLGLIVFVVGLMVLGCFV